MDRLSIEERVERDLAFHILNFGGGRDSTAMVLKVLNDELAPPDAILFADTGWERAGTHANVDRFADRIRDKGIEFAVVSDGNIRERALDLKVSLPVFTNASRYATVADRRELRREEARKAYRDERKKKDLFPNLFPDFLVTEDEFVAAVLEKFEADVEAGIIQDGWLEMRTTQMRRGCTHRHKIKPIRDWCKSHFDFSEDALLGTWLGIATDEWHRMSKSPEADTVLVYPLFYLGMSKVECVEYIEKCGYPVPVKSSCIGCPFHSDALWLELNDEERADAEAFERDLNVAISTGKYADKPYFANGAHLHRTKIPLSERPYAKKRKVEAGEQDGVCGEAGCFL